MTKTTRALFLCYFILFALYAANVLNTVFGSMSPLYHILRGLFAAYSMGFFLFACFKTEKLAGKMVLLSILVVLNFSGWLIPRLYSVYYFSTNFENEQTVREERELKETLFADYTAFSETHPDAGPLLGFTYVRSMNAGGNYFMPFARIRANSRDLDGVILFIYREEDARSFTVELGTRWTKAALKNEPDRLKYMERDIERAVTARGKNGAKKNEA